MCWRPRQCWGRFEWVVLGDIAELLVQHCFPCQRMSKLVGLLQVQPGGSARSATGRALLGAVLGSIGSWSCTAGRGEVRGVVGQDL